MPRLLLAAAVAAVALAGCDSATPDAAPPPIPSAAFSVATLSGGSGARSAAGLHFINGAARVGIVSAVIGVHLVVPFAATAAATAADPTVTAGVWTWDTTAAVGAQNFGLRLDGTPDGSEIDWRMQTTPGGGAPFTLYTGTTSLDGRTGAWTLFAPDAPGGLLAATFDVRSETQKTITFTVPAGRDAAGSTARYDAAGTTRRFDWTRQPENVRAVIEWDEATGAGSITAADYNGGARACWNGARQDVAC